MISSSLGNSGRETRRTPRSREVTPLKIGDLLYTCSPHQIVYALEAATGTDR